MGVQEISDHDWHNSSINSRVYWIVRARPYSLFLRLVPTLFDLAVSVLFQLNFFLPSRFAFSFRSTLPLSFTSSTILILGYFRNCWKLLHNFFFFFANCTRLLQFFSTVISKGKKIIGVLSFRKFRNQLFYCCSIDERRICLQRINAAGSVANLPNVISRIFPWKFARRGNVRYEEEAFENGMSKWRFSSR